MYAARPSELIAGPADVDAVRLVPRSAPAWAECAYALITVYAIFCNAWGIAIPRVGTASLGLLAVACSWFVVWRSPAVRQALVLPILCALSVIAIQMWFHGETLLSEFVISFATWMMSAVITQSLILRRGFLHRYALLCFVIMLLTWPYLRFVGDTGTTRAALERGISISNPNDLGAWYGFCAVYFMVIIIESRAVSLRLIASLGMTVCLLMVGLTVSRNPLFCFATASVIALRRTLQRGFVPLLMIIVGLNLAYVFGLFDQMITSYAARLTVDSGRLSLWPIALERAWNALSVGVGMSEVMTYVPRQGAWISPHNAFLLFALSSGIVPLMLLVAYVITASVRSVVRQHHPMLTEDQPFRLPLLVYTVLSCFSLDYAFMSQWGVLSLCAAMSVVELARLRRVSVSPVDAGAVRTRYA